MTKIAREIADLREQVREHDYRYHVLARPAIPDEQYDRLLRRLRALEEAHPELQTPDSPTQRVGGAPIEGFRHITHTRPMLSIDNTYNEQELREFDDRVRRGLGDEPFRYMVDPKIDGVAASLRYEHGSLVLVATRGDGQVGDDITHSARTIRAIPLRLRGGDPPAVLEVRGEIYWPLTNFNRFNEARQQRGEAVFANPRNATAGTLKQLDPRGIAGRGLSFTAHGMGEIAGAEFETQSDLFARLREWGMPVSPHAVTLDTIDQVLELIHDWDRRRHELDYLTDGLVIKVDSLRQRDILGATSKYPRWCIAFKFAAEQAETVLRNVTFQVGKLGTVTPVAELQPVLLSGTTVKRASLHNFDQVKRLGVRVGDTVVIEKAGEIIPLVVAVVAEKRPAGAKAIRRPQRCPECKGQVMQDDNGVFLRCINPSCPAQVRERLIYFCGRNQMDIEGAGPALIDQLLANNLIRGYADLYRLAEQRPRLLELERMGEKSVDNLLQGIEDSKKRPLSRLLTALNIQHIGATTAELLAEHFGDLQSLSRASEEDLLAVDGVGPELAASLTRFFGSAESRKTIDALRDAGLNMRQPRRRAQTRRPLEGRRVVVTGTLEHFTRPEIERLIKDLGGKPGGSVSKNTDLLVAGDQAGSKLQKARTLGVKVVSEAEFLKMADKK